MAATQRQRVERTPVSVAVMAATVRQDITSGSFMQRMAGRVQ
jgi:hypothetical protein